MGMDKKYQYNKAGVGGVDDMTVLHLKPQGNDP